MVYENVRRVAAEKGLTIRQVEIDAGLSPGSVGKWNAHSPKAISLSAVAKVLGTTVDELLKEME